MAKINFIAQAKGGVGKSFIATLLAQFIKEKYGDVKVIDTDTTNPTILEYKSLNAKYIALTENHRLDLRKFDEMMEILIASQDDEYYVIDVGSNGFQPLMAYAIENDAFNMLLEENHKVTINTVVAGGADTKETMKGALAIVEQTKTNHRIWINEYQHPAILNNKKVSELKKWQEYDSITAIIILPHINPDTTGKDIDEMLSERLTFDEYYTSAKLMPKKRIMNYQKTIWEQLENSEV